MTVYLATGRAFPDALAGGPAAASERSALLLVPPTTLDDADGTREFLRDRVDDLRLVRILGGRTAVSSRVEREVRDLVGADG